MSGHSPLNLPEIAARINAHLKRLEGDKEYNVPKSAKGISPLFMAGCAAGRGWVYITYVSFQGTVRVRRPVAEAYLAWLDAGNKGQHYRMGKV